MSARSARSIDIGLRNIVATIFILLAMVFVWEIRNTLMLMFAAVILVVLFTMPVRLLVDRLKINRAVAILISVLGFFVIIVLIGIPIFNTIADQFVPLQMRVNEGLTVVRQALTRESLEQEDTFVANAILIIDDFIRGGENAQPSDDLVGQAISQITDVLGRLGSSVLPVVGGAANTILSTLIIFFLSMYLLAEPDLYVNGIIKLTPTWYRGRMRRILQRLDSTLRAWLSVTGLSMVIVALLTGLGLRLIGIGEEAFALGVLAGLLSFVPNFGPAFALVPSVAVAIAEAPDVVSNFDPAAVELLQLLALPAGRATDNVISVNIIWVVVIIYGVSFVQSQVISPVLASERMNMPAILILLGQIIFGFFFGLLGLMLAVPLSACFAVLVDEIYVKDVLGDRSAAEAAENLPLEPVMEELLPEPSSP